MACNQRLLQLPQLPRRSPSSSSDSSLIPDRAGVTSAPAWPCLGFSMCPMVSIVPAKGHQLTPCPAREQRKAEGLLE